MFESTRHRTLRTRLNKIIREKDKEREVEFMTRIERLEQKRTKKAKTYGVYVLVKTKSTVYHFIEEINV